MSSSFIDIEKIGFWAGDGLVEVMQLCLINEIENSKLEEKENWLTDYKHELALESLPLIYGGMSMGLEEFVSSKKRIEVITVFINSIIKRINQEENYLVGEKMHDLRRRAMEILWKNDETIFKHEREFLEYVNYSRWKESVIHEFKDVYSRSFQLLKQLINSELETTAASPIDYW